MDETLQDITTPFLQSDLAQDVRNVYFEQTGHGLDTGPATYAVFQRFADLLQDANEGPVILLALAALQLQQGNVLQPIRDAALALIDDGSAARAWRQNEPALVKRRSAALKALADHLRAS